MDLSKKYEHFCTVGDLKKFIEKHNLPDDAKILAQRVEDMYFENGKIHPKFTAWETINKEGEWYHYALDWNERVDGEFKDKEAYPNLTPDMLIKIEGEELEKTKTKYIVCWCPVKYPDDNNLYLDLHY